MNRGALVLSGLLVGSGAGCSRPPERPPNVLFVTIDTLRADHCSTYGYARPTTPVLDSLAQEGLVFERAYAPMATTAPSHTTMFTGLLPRRHGVLRNGLVLGPDQETLAERLQLMGYRTGAVISSAVVARRMGFAQGFSSFTESFPRRADADRLKVHQAAGKALGFDQPADLAARKAIDWLRRQGDLDPAPPAAPFLLWVHFYDPHEPYAPPARYRKLLPPQGDDARDQLVAAYDAEIRFADDRLGAVLHELTQAGRLDDTLVVVVGDHGEGLLEHQGFRGHGPHLYEEAVHVPFIMRWPRRIPAGKRVKVPVSLADLRPTLLPLLQAVPPPEEPATPYDGLDLAPLFAGGRGDPQRPLLFQRREYESQEGDGFHIRGEKLALRVGRYKYIEARDEDSFELYDLDTDPGEQRNLLPEKQTRGTAMAGMLDRWRAVATARAASDDSPETAEALRALGYVR